MSPKKPLNGGKLNVVAYWYTTNPCFTVFEGEVSHYKLSLRAGLETVGPKVYPQYVCPRMTCGLQRRVKVYMVVHYMNYVVYRLSCSSYLGKWLITLQYT